ncbi:hypothetical protein OQA88_1508 [Cercophora sp. LCS_1]
MPRTTLLPTPASSTDIEGQDGSKLASLQLAFELPPPAVAPADTSLHSIDPSKSASYPMQASETVKSRRRSSAAQGPPKDQFALPPPPTRSRKIIQMKPREEPSTPTTATNAKAPKTAAPSGSTPAAAAGSKRKQPSATSAAGRKIARKTAHSLIERRRRSKMNEEFNVLKGLIPACSGEMHKLAILQASIEYVRYLEDCITKLKERAPQSHLPSPLGGEAYKPDRNFAFVADAHSPDVEMTSSSQDASPVMTPNASRYQHPSISPALVPQDARNHRDSYSSASSDYRHHSFSTSATTSPAFGPQTHGGYTQSAHSTAGSALTSPALPPQRDADQEATAALLMLNQTDRRGSTARGMSSPAAYSPPRNTKRDSFKPRILPVKPVDLHVNLLSYDHRSSVDPPPPSRSYTLGSSPSPPKKHTRAVFTSAKPRPLRLVQESEKLNSRKRRPPVFYAQSSHSVVQSLTCITIHQHPNKMASNPVMPKVAPLPSLPTGPRPVGTMSTSPQSKEQLLADLRRQLDDSASDVASSVGSRGSRRRRNRNNNKALAQAGNLNAPAILPRLADTKPVRLQLGLNLDVEVELKARLQGDVSLTLLVEKKPTKRPSTQLRPDLNGVVDGAEELFYMRLGVLRLRQRWIDREVSSSLTVAVALGIAAGGFVAGVLVSRWFDSIVVASQPWHAVPLAVELVS